MTKTLGVLSLEYVEIFPPNRPDDPLSDVQLIPLRAVYAANFPHHTTHPAFRLQACRWNGQFAGHDLKSVAWRASEALYNPALHEEAHGRVPWPPES